MWLFYFFKMLRAGNKAFSTIFISILIGGPFIIQLSYIKVFICAVVYLLTILLRMKFDQIVFKSILPKYS